MKGSSKLGKLKWLGRMAWRDSRFSRGRLFLYISSISLGVAALVAVNSFADNLMAAVGEQAKTLLGADLAISSRQAFTDEALALFDSLDGEQSTEVSFASMAYFPVQQGTRLVQVRALDGGFPFYGDLQTDPAKADAELQRDRVALVDHNLMLQFGAAVGDPIKLGQASFRIAGSLKKIPGELPSFSGLGARVFIPLRFLDDTGLIQPGSRVGYKTYFQFQPERDVESLVENLETDLSRLGLSADTVSQRQRNLGRSMENLTRFLNLAGFIALVLGGVGIASAVHLYIRQRMASVAILRCLGATPAESFSIYLVQLAGMGLVGALLGAFLGAGSQEILPWVLGGLIPVEAAAEVSWRAVAAGLIAGLLITLLFALIPLLKVRHVSPLRTLRADFETERDSGRDWLVYGCFGIILAVLLGFSLFQTENWRTGLGFFAGLVGVLVLLYLVARLLMFLVRRYFPGRLPYEWRQSLANLYRPQNQTAVLVLALGLATFSMVTLYLIQVSLLDEVAAISGRDKANLVLFDIQSDQKEPVEKLVQSFGLPVQETVPIVTMRLSAVNGRDVEKLRVQPDSDISEWALTREYRSTYRDHLSETETLRSGTFPGNSKGVAGVSLERHIARELGVSEGDSLTFDVQGVPLETKVSSIREVDWRNFRPNFFVVFPDGVLEEAPQFHVLLTRAETPEQAAELQATVVQRFPNVSAIDLDLVLETVDSVLDRVVFAIRFMSLFTVLTALIVLSAAIVSSRYQRLRESVLLRTLGATRRQMRRIFVIEYALLGALGGLAGLALAFGAAWAVLYFVFESVFIPSFNPALIALAAVILVTVVIGLLNSRGVCEHPPLEILRTEP